VSASAALDESGWNRAWDRGYARGFERGVRSELLAVVYCDVVAQLFEVLRIPESARREIWKQGLFDVDQEHGELPSTTRCALAARRIAVLLVRRFRTVRPRTYARV
jgi:hypothetical protein